MAEEILSEYHINSQGLRSVNNRMTGADNPLGEPIGKVAIFAEGATLKTRSAADTGTTKEEIKFGLGDVITGVVVSSAFSGGKTNAGNYLLICFDCTSVVADALLGTGTTLVQSLSSDIPIHQVNPGETLAIDFSEALSFADNAGFLGNMWVRSVDATNTLDSVIHGVDRT